ncbi:transposase, Mutator family, partial [Salmonella enterica subsp. enterica serovar Baildon str. R6-199]
MSPQGSNTVKEQVIEWQNRQMDTLYPFVYMDCMLSKFIRMAV